MPEAQIKERGRRRWRGKKRAMYSQYCSSMPHTPWESRRWKQLSEIKLPLCYNAALSCLHWQISFLIPCRTERHSQQTPNYRHTLLSGCNFWLREITKEFHSLIFFFQWNFLVRINKNNPALTCRPGIKPPHWLTSPHTHTVVFPKKELRRALLCLFLAQWCALPRGALRNSP